MSFPSGTGDPPPGREVAVRYQRPILLLTVPELHNTCVADESGSRPCERRLRARSLRSPDRPHAFFGRANLEEFLPPGGDFARARLRSKNGKGVFESFRRLLMSGLTKALKVPLVVGNGTLQVRRVEMLSKTFTPAWPF